MSEILIHGRCDEAFAPVRDAFEQNFRDGLELGAACAIDIEGERVVDLWAGHTDPSKRQDWQRDTLVNLFSTTKGFTAFCAHKLVAEGKLDVDAPVASYWPEFAQAGKGDMPVRWLLSHRAGLAGVKELLPNEALYDWEATCEALAAQAPWWTPGEAHGYHAVTYGWLVGEVVRRIDGRSLGTYFREEFAEPLGADLHIGLPEAEHGRVSNLVPTLAPPADAEAAHIAKSIMGDPEGLTARAFANPPSMALGSGTREWREAEIPAANGHGTAAGLATLYGRAALADGGGVIDPVWRDQVRTENSRGPDKVLGVETRFGLGFMLPLDHPNGGSTLGDGALGHPGAGGSFGYADPERRMGFGYAMNQMGTRILLDDRVVALTEAATKAAPA